MGAFGDVAVTGLFGQRTMEIATVLRLWFRALGQSNCDIRRPRRKFGFASGIKTHRFVFEVEQ